MTNITVGSVALNRVVAYTQSVESSIPVKKIPSRATAIVDIASKVVSPERRIITAYVSAANKNTLKGYKGSYQTFVDDEASTSCIVEDVTPEYRIGYTGSLPWMVKISVLMSGT